MTALPSLQQFEKTRQVLDRGVVSPPHIAAFEDLFPWMREGASSLSASQKAQRIMEANGLDGLEMGDHPYTQMSERPTVYEVILSLFAHGWSYDRINDWCGFSKRMCRFTLNGQIVR